MKKQTSLLILLVFIISCKSQNIIVKNDTKAILHAILNLNKNSCLDEKPVYEQSSTPKDVIEHVTLVFNNLKYSDYSDPFFINNDNVINRKILTQLKQKNFDWQKKNWTQSEVSPFKNSLYNNLNWKEVCSNKSMLQISEPIYSKNRKSALVLFSKWFSGVGNISILFFKKEKQKWVIKGQAAYGTIG